MDTAKERGFTLVEVMVALVIVSIALVTLLATHSQSTRNYAEAKALAISTLLAEGKLAELQSGDLPVPGEQDGGFENNEHYGWSLKVNETASEMLREVVLNVHQLQGEGDSRESGLKGVTVVTYLADLGKKEEKEEELN